MIMVRYAYTINSPVWAHPCFQNVEDEFKSFPTVYDMSIFNKIWVVICRWKALELCFRNKGAPMVCLGALRPNWRICGKLGHNLSEDPHLHTY